MNAAPLSWIQEIQSTLIDMKAIPLFGHFPPFPWEEYAQKIAALLKAQECKIYPRQTGVKSGSDILAGLGASPICVALDLTPLSSQVYWVMGREDVASLTALALTSSPESQGFSSAKFQEGFYYYLCTEAVQAIGALKTLGDLSLKIGVLHSLPQEEAVCTDVELSLSDQTFWGRLVCPASFHKEFKTHFSQEKPGLLKNALRQEMDVTVQLELGYTSLSWNAWKNVKAGDFILLDRCSFDPVAHKGTATVTLKQTPLFRARIKDTHLKIVDYALYQQENTPMNPKGKEEEDPHPQDPFDAEDLSSTEMEEETHLWAEEAENAEQLISPGDVPITLSIELARLQINLDKLLQLSPGNVLELPVRPEQGVDVVAEGKKIAKAELVKLGEVLGIKILRVGHE